MTTDTATQRRCAAGPLREGAGPAAPVDPPRPAPGALRLRLLGTWELLGVHPGAPVPHAVRRLLTHLALRGRVGREELAASMWPEATAVHAHGCLRTALWRARAVHPALVLSDGEAVGLHPGVRVDVAELAEDVRRLDAGELPPHLRTVPAHPLLEELVPGCCDEWLTVERERVRQLQLHALEAVATALAAEGHHALALEAALAAVRREPLRESAHRVVVLLHLLEGNRSEALRHARAYGRLLERELGVPPSPAVLEVLERDAAARVLQRRPGRFE